MPFSRQDLMESLKELQLTPLSPDFKDELVKLVVKKLGYTSDDLNQEQLNEVHEFSRQMHSGVRSRYNKTGRNLAFMLQKFHSFFGEIVSFTTITARQPSKSGVTIIWCDNDFQPFSKF
jgi:hypothetical protein